MGRSPRIDLEGHWYHVVARGQRQEPLFHEESDYRRYLKELDRALTKGEGKLGAYSLMTNHVHLLVKRGLYPLARVLLIAHSRYSKYYNRKYGKTGHVFQGRYKSKIVLKDRYLERLIIYIHRNAVRAGIVELSSQYRWSSDWFYRGIALKDDVKLTRAPRFEGKTGENKYKELIDTEPAEIHEFKKYIGYEGEETAINRRKSGREGRCFYDRRIPAEIKRRLIALCEIEGVKLAELKSQSRVRSITKVRSKIMKTLYEENYPAVNIARELNRTPSSIFRALGKHGK
ncbi:MAG: transposase [Elusimicrobiota bacterium]|nr:transposase [Elusimicrobiota bacterium]